jgi:hypothetical protein
MNRPNCVTNGKREMYRDVETLYIRLCTSAENYSAEVRRRKIWMIDGHYSNSYAAEWRLAFSWLLWTIFDIIGSSALG